MEVTGQEARFRAMFAEEAEGRLATLSELLLELERNGEDQELLSSVFREAHTLKGAAAVVGLADVLRVAHAMEEVLEGLRRGDPATPAAVDALLSAVDGMREMVPAVLAGEDRAGHADRLVAALHDPTPALEPPPDPGPAPGPPPSPEPAPAPAQPTPGRERRETVRLRVERLDELVRLVGEASAAALRVGRVVTDQLGVEPAGVPELHDLSRILESLQERTLQARMVPFGTIAEPLRRTARDLARSLGKAVELELRGQETELDRGVLEQVADPMLHLVRNAIDHGIELPEARLAAGKPRYGTVRVHAAQLGSEVVVTVADDGQGIDLARVRQQAGEAGDALDGVGDDEAIYAIFRSGLSTAATVSEVSGRGVGLDVVRASLASVRGRVEVHSEPGAGSEFRLNVPITLAVLPCLLVEAAGRRFGVPMHSVVSAEAAGWSEDHVEGQVVIRVRDTILPVSDLAATLGVTAGQAGAPASDSPAVVLASMTRRHAFRVDALLGQRNVVVKDLGRLLPRLALLAGASLEPDGSILLVLDVSGLVDRARWSRSGGAGRAAPSPTPAVPAPAGPASVLVVDDTTVVRELERSILEEAGYLVRTAADGRLALAALADTPADLVVTDVEMPNCDGLELTRAIRAQPALTGLPVVVVTSRSSDADRRLAMDAGADAYLVKGDLDRRTLLEVVGRLLGRAVQPAGEGRAVTAVRVVVVEDSPVQRAHLVDVLEAERDIAVIGQAGDPVEAVALVQRLRPDVVTMDLGLPGDGGLGVIEQIMAGLPTPILVLSTRVTCAGSAAAVESLLAGAVEALPRPERWDAEAERQLRCRVRLLSGVTVVAHPRGRRRPPAPDPYRAPPVAIAASTGGPAALAEILPSLGGLAVPVLVVQHLHPQLVDGFVGWMQRVSALPVVVAADGDRPQPGVVYIAPAGAHLKLAPAPGLSGTPVGPPRAIPTGGRRLVLDPGPPGPHRPSADELFRSVAATAGGQAVGVLLTGMGEDGAAGLLALRRQGAVTIAQDEPTSVVFGMPQAAQRLGAAGEVLGLGQIQGAIRGAVAGLVR